MIDDGQLVPVFIPSLAALLLNAERGKGAALTETEVLDIRDRGVCMMMPVEQRDQLTGSRGYRDIDPENCWAEWLALRVELDGNGQPTC
jgi:hypothetical protein